MQDRFQQVKERVVYYWPTYGPPILGAVLVLLALFVGYRILSNRSNNTATTPSVTESNLTLNTEGSPTPSEPGANVTLPAGQTTPTPEQALGGASRTKGGLSATNGATTSGTTKGGQKLPETGFPLVLAIPGLIGATAGGFKLTKVKKS